MTDWIRIEADSHYARLDMAGQAYYINLANVATIQLYTDERESETERRPAATIVTVAGVPVTLHGDEVRAQLRRELDQRCLETQPLPTETELYSSLSG